MPKNRVEKFAVLDLETDPFKKGRGLGDDPILPFCGGWHDGKLTETVWGVGESYADKAAFVCRWLVERIKKFRGIIYAHNGGNFDFHFLLEFLPVEDCQFFVVGKRIVEIKTPWGAVLRDSYAIIPKALAAYGKEEISYNLFERNKRERHKAKILAYLVSDLKNLWNMVAGFAERFAVKKTLASSTAAIMKADFGIDPERMGASHDAIFRPYYFAGRVEFWKLGKCSGKLSTVDLNSAFPYAMTFPHWEGGIKQAGKRWPKNPEQCFFEVDCVSLGALPQRMKDKSVGFPCGEGHFFATGWELCAGMELGLISDVKICRVYEPERRRDYAKFVNYFYERKNAARAAGDKDEEFFNKIVLNSGYGRFALNPTRYREISVSSFAEMPKRKKGVERDDGYRLEWDDERRGLSFWSINSYREGIDEFINVATAASITGCVRAMLLRAMVACEGVVYCDTDSITAADVSALPQSNALGQWKLEMTYDSRRSGEGFWIAGKKLYAGKGRTPDGKEKWKTASKGVRLSPEKIVSVALGNEEKMTFDAPTFSVFSPPKFVSRRVNRADLRKTKKSA